MVGTALAGHCDLWFLHDSTRRITPPGSPGVGIALADWQKRLSAARTAQRAAVWTR